jgi:hypothetical protein
MNMTNNAFLSEKSLKETVFSETTSGRLNSGTLVPSESIVDSVNAILFLKHYINRLPQRRLEFPPPPL